MSPQFVETVPRRGYRFIAPVGIIAHGDNPEPGGETVVAQAAIGSVAVGCRI